MSDNRAHLEADAWSNWLLYRRHGGDPMFAHVVQKDVAGYADRVIDQARLAPGMTLVDIGAGEGIVAFRAIERIGPSLRVLLTDISGAMLRHAEGLAIERGVRPQCTFLRCAADQLTEIPDTSVDVVATRAVLAYVADKPAALREFYRILKPGGCVSFAEPILQDDALMASALRSMIEARGARSHDRFLPLLHRWKAAQFPDTPEKIANSPIANYSERNLFDFVRTSGFTEIHLELHLDLVPTSIRSWNVFLSFSPHPWAPPLSVILAEQFTLEERQYFEQVVRPVVESPNAVSTTRMTYLTATKPLSHISRGRTDSAILATDR
jgi:ubiquinone/menaquinone biosynthesis C-methylase UbiE